MKRLTMVSQFGGTKTLIAAAVAAILIPGASSAADGWHVDYVGTKFQASNYITGSHETTGLISADKSWETNVPSNYDLVYLESGSTLTAKDASFNLNTSTPVDNTTQLQSIGIQVAGNAKLELIGNTASVSVETNAYGTNNSQASGINVVGGSVADSASVTNISVISTRKNGKAIYGVAAGSSGTVDFKGDALKISLRTATDRDVNPNNLNHRGEALGIDVYDKGKITTSSNTAVTINVIGTGTTAVDASGTYPTGASTVAGIVAEGGIIDLGGTNDITVTSDAGLAKGIRVTNAAYTMTGGESQGDGAVTLGGPTTIAVTSTKGDVYGIDASEFALPSGTTATGGIAVKTIDSLTISASSGDDAKAIGIAVNDKAIVDLNGLTTITAKNVFSGNGTINLNSTLIANGSLADFTGKLNIGTGGSFTLTAEHGELSDGVINLSGGQLAGMTSILFDADDETVLIDKTAENVGIAGDGRVSLQRGITIAEDGGTIVVSDAGYYTSETLKAMSEALSSNNTTLRFETATLYKEEGESAQLTDNVIQETEQATALTEVDTNGEAALSANKAGAQSVVIEAKQSGTNVVAAKITGTGLTLVGSSTGGALVSAASDASTPIDITIGDGENKTIVTLGAARTATKGKLANVTVSANSALAIDNIAATASTLMMHDGSKVTVGSDGAAGTLDVSTLNMQAGSTIFLDPAVFGDVWDASRFAAQVVDGTIKGEIIAGQNAVISLGAASDDACTQIQRVLTLNGLTWGTEITSAFYLGSAVTLDVSNAYLVSDGSLTQSNFTSAADSNYSAGTLSIAAKGLLAVDQNAVIDSDTALVGGTVKFADGSTFALVNTNKGEFTLANTVIDAANATVITDNPFYSASFNSEGKVVSTQETAQGSAAIASAGIQAMTRRADLTFFQTIDDRASIDQELNPGINLWADVSGEAYEMDDIDHGGDFKADVFYGAFGGDVQVAQGYTVGAAFQYGTGSVRSSVNGIKNDIDNYGLALYGTAKFGNIKTIAEFSYIWGDNDITANQAALNQSVDTNIYSFGVTGMYEFRAGQFSFVPSIGLRVSQLETDAMHVGNFRVEDQDQTLFQIPLVLRINGAEMSSGGWKLAPSLKIAYVPTFGDKELSIQNVDTDVIDVNPVQIDFGVRAGTENMLINAAFTVGAGQEGSSSVGGKIGLKYAF